MLDAFSRAAGEQKQTILQELNENQGFQFLCDAIDLTEIEGDEVTDIDEYDDVISIYGDENDDELNSTSTQLGSLENLDPLQLGRKFDAEVYVEDHNLSIVSSENDLSCDDASETEIERSSSTRKDSIIEREILPVSKSATVSITLLQENLNFQRSSRKRIS